MKYKNLFTPITIGSTRLKNRIAMAPINNSSQMDPATGQATMTMVDYFAERARGGAGLITTGVFKVEYDIEQCVNLEHGTRKWAYFSPQSTLMLGEMVARIHAFDSKIFFQLSAGPGRVTPPDVILSGVEPVSSSENNCHFVPEAVCRALETSEVEQIVAAFGRAAAFARSINADGIEVHGHEGYLIDQFTTSLWNRRTDKYGGDLKGRLTFPIEILRAIKEAAGEDFTVVYRMGVRHFITAPGKGALHLSEQEIGRGVEESVEMAKLLEEAGYDGFSVDVGAYESSFWAHPPVYMPHGFALDLTATVKDAVSVPVMVAGRLGVPELADNAIADGKTDIIALARDLLADPDWPNKVARDELQQIRPCIGCHDGCIERTRTEGQFLSCSVNPAASRERNAKLIPVRVRGKRILVAGGGPAGMEIARIASQRGHEVTIFEKSNQLGGHMLEYGTPAFKDDIKALLSWYQLQIAESNVRVEYGCTVDAGLVASERPDVVVAATGSSYRLPSAEGSDLGNVVVCTDMLTGVRPIRGHIVVVGGGSHGAETALWLARQGATVTIVDRADEILTSGMNRINKSLLVALLKDEGVTLRTRTSLGRYVSSGVEVHSERGARELIECDLAVAAIGVESNQQLYGSLVGITPELHQIGDSKQPRKIHDAIHEGWYLGLNIS